MEGVNIHIIVIDIGKLSHLKYHSEEFHKDEKQQLQQFLLGLNKKLFLQQKDIGK